MFLAVEFLFVMRSRHGTVIICKRLTFILKEALELFKSVRVQRMFGVCFTWKLELNKII